MSKTKLKWKRTKDGIVFVDPGKTTRSRRKSRIPFMLVSMVTFGLSLILFLISVILAVVKKGEAGMMVGFLPMVSLILAGYGVYVTWEGHRSVKNKGEDVPWILSLWLNGAMIFILFVLYVSGIKNG